MIWMKSPRLLAAPLLNRGRFADDESEHEPDKCKGVGLGSCSTCLRGVVLDLELNQKVMEGHTERTSRCSNGLDAQQKQ
jgi:hypothetical protein